VDCVITDPPYGLSFMGKKWDYDVPSQAIWEQCLRVLKPGGYLLAFAGTRTQHRMAVRIEDAGFEIRDMIAWVYGSGFPKSLNISKAIEGKLTIGSRNTKDFGKLNGEEINMKIGFSKNALNQNARPNDYYSADYEKEKRIGKLIPTTPEAKEWEGWGTALKPALEPVTVARKPLSEKTVAENCLKWGTGGINIDGCRVGSEERTYKAGLTNNERLNDDGWEKVGNDNVEKTATGRFPANLIHDGSDEVVSLFPNTKGSSATRTNSPESKQVYGDYGKVSTQSDSWGDSGSAARYFYCAKASKSERNKGCEGLEEKLANKNGQGLSRECSLESRKDENGDDLIRMKNNHPTVKPIALMEYLVKLVSREGAIILDPFTGSGSTLIACKQLGRSYIGIELDPKYCEIAEARLAVAKKQPAQQILEFNLSSQGGQR
jgi:DNA modification methylase